MRRLGPRGVRTAGIANHSRPCRTSRRGASIDRRAGRGSGGPPAHRSPGPAAPPWSSCGRNTSAQENRRSRRPKRLPGQDSPSRGSPSSRRSPSDCWPKRSRVGRSCQRQQLHRRIVAVRFAKIGEPHQLVVVRPDRGGERLRDSRPAGRARSRCRASPKYSRCGDGRDRSYSDVASNTARRLSRTTASVSTPSQTRSMSTTGTLVPARCA